MSAVRRAGIAILLLILAGGAAIVSLPQGAGAVRLAGVSVTWWYASGLGPVAAVAVAILALCGSRRAPPS